MPLLRRKFLLGSSLLTIGACSHFSDNNVTPDLRGLKDLYKDNFLIGCALNKKHLEASNNNYFSLLNHEFNAITMENAMKWENLHPSPDQYNWQTVDHFLQLCDQHGHAAIGHVLVWHSQTPAWVFNDEKTKPLSRSALLKRMEKHIQTTTDYCRKKIWAWDVVNEAFEDNGDWRKSPWKEQIGTDFIAKAFLAAHESDPNAHLIYNDYNMHLPEKRAAVVSLIRQFKVSGIPIHGIGMQGHIGIEDPDLTEFEKSIQAFIKEGLQVHITELDIDVLPNPYLGADIATRFDYTEEKDPYKNGLPLHIADQQAKRAEDLFNILLRYQDMIARVSFWGISDKDSWKNDFPIVGRTNYPLLFDRALRGKPVLSRLKQIAPNSL